MSYLSRRRNALMRIGGEEYALTKKDQPVILAAFYNAGLCASLDYMTIEEAGLITNTQFNSVNFKDAVEDFSGFRYFTGVTEIKQQRFAAPYNFTKIIMPNSITSIGWAAFNGCQNMLYADVGDSLMAINTGVFRFCQYLETLVIGSSVTTMTNIFSGTAGKRCTTVICKPLNPPTASSFVFSSSAIIYVPNDSISSYQASEFWGNYTIKGITEYKGD